VKANDSRPARHGQADLRHIHLEERLGAIPSDQDAELDKPYDLGVGHAGEVGKCLCRQPVHAAIIPGVYRPDPLSWGF
jgi:hypothetical protein